MLFTLVLNTSGGDRTHSPLLRRQVRYPLRHGGVYLISEFLVFVCYHYTTIPRDSQESNLDLLIVSQMRKVRCCKFTYSRFQQGSNLRPPD